MAKYTSNINITSSRLADGWVDAWLSSETDTTATIYWEIGCRQKYAALYGQEAYCYVDGSYVGYTSGHLSSSSSDWKTVCSTSGYATVNKTASGRNVPVTIDTRVTPIDGYGSVTTDWASATVNVWIGGKPTYTVTYNANGGSGAPSSQTKYHGQSLTLSSTTPTRTGYTFLGWSTSSTATSATYSAGGSYTSNSAATLYAVWKLNSWTVSYNANGGSGAPSNQTKNHGTDLTLSSTIPTRTGYIFKGWATSSTGSVAYAAGATYTSDSAVTLYAVWEAEVYTISFDANGGENAPSSQQKTYGVNLILSTTIPTREGYEFIGWGTSASSTAASYSAGGSFNGNADTTLYAIWSLVVVCSITYDANGGMNAPESQLHEAESVSILSTAKPTRDKYSFSGWALDSSATKAVYLSGGTYINDDFINGDVITLYAVWTREYEVFVRVPEGRNIKNIYVRLPKGLFNNNGSVYEDKQLETLDGLELLDSQDNYVVVRGV